MALRRRSQGQLLDAAIFLALVTVANCHAGHLHAYPEQDPLGNNWKGTLVATCSTWKKPATPTKVVAGSKTTPVATKLSAAGTGRRLHAGEDHSNHAAEGHDHDHSTMTPSKTTTAAATKDANVTATTVDSSTLSVKGVAQLWVYLEANCSNSVLTGIRTNLTFTTDGEPAVRVPVMGHVQTGSCSVGGGSMYIFDSKAGDTDENLLFFDTMTSAAGVIRGISPNEGAVVTKGTVAAKSIVLYHNKTAFSCCDLDVEEPSDDYATPLVQAGKNCSWVDMEDTKDPNQLGMLMHGVWRPCTKVNGVYMMDHGDGMMAECLDFRNGTRLSKTATSTTETGANSTSKNTTGHNHNGAAGHTSSLQLYVAAVAAVFLAVLAL